MILNEFTMLQDIEAEVSIVQESFIFLIIGVIGIFTEQLHLTTDQIDPRSKFCWHNSDTINVIQRTFRSTSSTQTPVKVKQTAHGRKYEDTNTAVVGVRSSCVVCCVCVKSLQDVSGSWHLSLMLSWFQLLLLQPAVFLAGSATTTNSAT